MFLALVPAYNEEQTIGSVVRSLFEHVDGIVVVDDGSDDNTAIEGEMAGALVLRHEINRGQGAALETGHEYARRVGADFVLHFDGDGQFDVSNIQPALRALQESGADVLLGSRFLTKGVTHDPAQAGECVNRREAPFIKRTIILPVARLFHRLLYGINQTDAHNGFRILNRRALEKIALTQDRMAHATELLAQADGAGLRMVEFPVTVRYSEYGQGIAGGVKILQDLTLGMFVRK